MFKNYLRNLGARLLWKLGKILVILVIAFITWETVVKEKSEAKGRRLYHESQQLYKEIKDGSPAPSPTYEFREDSSYIMIIEK